MSSSSESRLIGGMAGWNPRASQQQSEEKAAEAELDAAASREESERQMAYIRALGNPRLPTVELPEIKAPAIADDLAERITKLDQEIFERGIAIDRERLVSLRREHFEELLLKDREARRLGRVIGSKTDLTQFRVVYLTLANMGLLAEIPIPARTMGEQVAGSGREKDAARKVESFSDLWKLGASEPNAIRDVYAFRDVFDSVVFGHSLLECLDQNGRAYSHFFAGGSDERVDYFTDWFAALKGKHLRVTFKNALQSLVWWLCDEETPPIETIPRTEKTCAERQPLKIDSAVVVDSWRTALRENCLFGSDFPMWGLVIRACLRGLP